MLLLALQTASYASWWSWHGGFVWGPRFLLPVLPLLMLFMLPVLERRAGAIATIPLALLSAAIQIPALLYDFVPYTLSLYADYASGVAAGFYTGLRPEVYYRVDLSPILGQFKVMAAGEQALRPALAQPTLNGAHGLLIGILLVCAIAGYNFARKRFSWAVVPIMLLSLLAVALLQRSNLATAQTFAQLGAADQIIAATTDYNIALVDLKSPERIVTTNAPTAPDDPLAAGLWAGAMQRGGLAWFVTWFPPANDQNWQERDLWRRASFVRETTLVGDRALLFDLHPPAEVTESGGWQFGPLQLAAYGLSHDSDGLRVALGWNSDRPVDANYTWFVHLIDANSQIIQQQDRAPLGGYAPTSSWQAGETVADHLFFPVEGDLSGWQLRIGVLDPTTGAPLPVIDAQGQTLSEAYILLPIQP